jgi:hypothetical protein
VSRQKKDEWAEHERERDRSIERVRARWVLPISAQSQDGADWPPAGGGGLFKFGVVAIVDASGLKFE